MNTTVFLRKESGGFKVVGIDRQWPGKQIADPALEEDLGISAFGDLEPVQQKLLEGFTAAFNERSGRDLSTQEYFDSMSVSERTTYDAVTHALMSSELTDQEGNDLGTALDLVEGVEKVAGQYYGRGGDQQFRLYSFLVPDAKETLRSPHSFSGARKHRLSCGLSPELSSGGRCSQHSVFPLRRRNESRHRCGLSVQQDAGGDVQRTPHLGELRCTGRRQP